MKTKPSPGIDFVGVNERAKRFTTRSIKAGSKLQALNTIISMTDLTTLDGKDTKGKVLQLCQKAICPDITIANVPHVAAVCVYPNMVAIAKKELNNTGINVASVATAFPGGMSSMDIKINETKFAVEEGADEIDMVISRGKFLEGEYEYVYDEIAAVKDACGKAHLKVILETGELGTFDHIRKASDIAMYAGADFIKTSTGKIQPAATLPVTLVMLEAIRDFYYIEGKMIGMKPAGGISNSKLAIQYLVMLGETLGDKWMTPDYFRFGASSLLNDVLMQIKKQQSGVYQSENYFSKD